MSGDDTDRIERIRERAHQIWENEGRPDGREMQHWEQASREIDAESTGQGVDTGKVLPPGSGAGSQGLASGLQPGGSIPSGGPGTGVGSVGTGGGSTAARPTGTAAKSRRKAG